MDLYSRQIGAFGLEAMMKLTSLKVLLVGIRGVGVETAKNAILAGIHALTIVDDEPTQIRDLGSNFFLTEADLGKPRAAVCAPKLAELNRLVKVECHHGELTEALVGSFDVVVFTCGDNPTLVRWNEFCRSRTKSSTDERGFPVERPAPIAFISCLTAGACGSVFSDFGPGFIVRDKSGRDPFVKIVTSLKPMVEYREVDGAEVASHYTLVHYLTPVGQATESIPDGTLVTFSEVEGMYSRTEEAHKKFGLSINTSGAWRCWHPDSDPINTVRISDTRAFSVNMCLLDFCSLTTCVFWTFVH